MILKTLKVILDGDPKGLNQALGTAEKSIKKSTDAFGKMGRKIAGVLSAGLAVKFFKDAARAASDFEESASKFSVVFEGVTDEAAAAAKNLKDNYGMAKQEALAFLSGTGDILTGLGASSAEALKLSDMVQKLSVDLASFQNLKGGAAQASEALTKGMLGEREMLKGLGVVIRETDVQQRLLETGQNKLTGTAKQLAVAEVTLQMAMEQSKNAIGDYARTSDSWANTVRRAGSSWQDFLAGVGKGITENTKLKGILQDVTDLLGSDEFQKDVASFVGDLIEGTATLVNFGSSAIGVISDVVNYLIGSDATVKAIIDGWRSLLVLFNDEMGKVEDLQMGAIVRGAEKDQITTDRFNSLRDSLTGALNLSKDTFKNIRADFAHIEDRAIKINKMMQAIRDGKYGKAMAEQYQVWLKEQKKAHEAIIKEIEAQKENNKEKKKATVISKEQQKAINKERKAYEALAESMGILTKSGMADLENDMARLNTALDVESPGIVGNWDSIDKIGEQVQEWIDKYKQANREIPPVLLLIEKKLNDVTAATRKLSGQVVIPEVEEDSEMHLDALFGIDDLEKNLLDLSRPEGAANGAKNTMEVVTKTTIDLGEAFKGCADLADKAVKSLANLGIIGEGLAGFLGSLTGAIGGIGAGIQQINNASKMVAGGGDKFLGFLGKASGWMSIATTAASLLGEALGAIFGKSTLISDSVGKWDVSDDLAAKIEELADSMAGKSSSSKWNAAEAAISTYFDEIIRQSDVTAQNFGSFVRRTRDILADLDRGMMSSSETVDALGRAFTALVEEGERLGTIGGRDWWAMIGDIRGRGLEVDEIEKYMEEAGKEGAEAYKNLNDYIIGLKEDYNSLIEDAKKARGDGDKETAEKLEEQAAAKLREFADLSGLSLGFYDDILAYEQKIKDNQGLVTYIDNIKTALYDLVAAKEKGLSQEDMNNFNLAARQGFEKLLNSGFTIEEAYGKTKPILEKLIFLQNEWGLVIDDDTQRIIDQGIEMGVLSEDYKSQGDIMREIGEKQLSVLEQIASALGVNIPGAMDDMAQAGDAAFKKLKEGADGFAKGLSEIKIPDLTGSVTFNVDATNLPDGGGSIDWGSFKFGGSFAKGGDFVTTADQFIKVHRNEHVTVTPLSASTGIGRTPGGVHIEKIVFNVPGMDYARFKRDMEMDNYGLGGL